MLNLIQHLPKQEIAGQARNDAEFEINLMRIELKSIIKPSFAQIILYVFLGLVIWAVSYVGSFYTRDITFDELLAQLFGAELLLKNAIGIGLTAVNAGLLFVLVNRFSFVNIRTFFPTFVFALLIAVWQPSHETFKSHIALFLFICALFCFFNMSEKEASEKTFLGSLLIACAGLFLNNLLLIIPVCWLGFIVLRCFSFRVFLASLLGVIAPLLIYSVVIYAVSPTFDFQSLFNFDFSLNFGIKELQLPTQLYIGLLFVVFIISILGTYADFYTQNNSIRRNINFILILLVSFVIILNFEKTLFPFIALCFSIFASHIFSTKKNNFYPILFRVFIFINLAFVVYNFLY